MSYGIQIFNSSGILQITEEYSNHLLIQSGTVSVSANLTASISFPDTSSMPLIAIRTMSGAQIAITDYSTTGCTFAADNHAGTIEYRIYRSAAGMAASNEAHGFRVWSPSGNLVFDSGRQGLRIGQVSSFNTNTLAGSGANISHSLGNAYAVLGMATPLAGFVFDDYYGAPCLATHIGVQTSNNSIALKPVYRPTGIPVTYPNPIWYDSLRTLGILIP